VKHVESRPRRRDSEGPSSFADRHQCHHLELLIKFDGHSDDLSSTVKTMTQLSAVDDLTVIGDWAPQSKGMIANTHFNSTLIIIFCNQKVGSEKRKHKYKKNTKYTQIHIIQENINNSFI